MTSGSSRSAPRRAAAKERVWVWTSRWVTWHPFDVEDVFDRVLERDDVVVPGAVDLLDERGQRGRFAAADRAGHEHQAVVILREELRGSRAGPISSIVRILVLMMRKTRSIPRRWRTTLARKRPKRVGVGEIDIAPLRELLLCAR